MKEIALQFGTRNSLSGIVSEPDGEPHRTGIILLNAGLVHRMGPFRLNVNLARQLSARGFIVLRLDFCGLGYSMDPSSYEDELANATSDIDAAVKQLTERYCLEEFSLVGLCSGADNAYRIALQRPQINGLVLLDCYAYTNLRNRFNHYLRRIFRLSIWIDWARSKFVRKRPKFGGSPSLAEAEGRRDLWEVKQPPLQDFRHGLKDLVGRGAKLLFVYSGGAVAYNYEGQLKATVPEARNQQVTVVHYPDADHTYVLSNDRKRLVTQVTRWINDNFGSTSSD